MPNLEFVERMNAMCCHTIEDEARRTRIEFLERALQRFIFTLNLNDPAAAANLVETFRLSYLLPTAKRPLTTQQLEFFDLPASAEQ